VQGSKACFLVVYNIYCSVNFPSFGLSSLAVSMDKRRTLLDLWIGEDPIACVHRHQPLWLKEACCEALHLADTMGDIEIAISVGLEENY
jgi:hypothetical protein